MAQAAPLLLFWYRQEQNFGDAISPMITAHVSGREVAWGRHLGAQLYGLGSLMRMVAVHQRDGRDAGAKPVIWGTGAMGPLPNLGFLDHVDIALLRGPMTAALLNRNDREFGDPGLLINEVLGEAPPRGDHIAVVPHMHFADDPEIRAVVAADPRLRFVDVRDPDPMAVVREIASAAHVISQSLHGLITADAFGIPNSWLDPSRLPGARGLKFHDYGAGIGRAMGLPLDVGQIAEKAPHLPTGPLTYADGIAASRAALWARFPKSLRLDQESPDRDLARTGVAT
jgi:pyruvyltransferase